MDGDTLGTDLKTTSVLRRVPPLTRIEPYAGRGLEGHVCAFELARDGSPIEVEAASGRWMVRPAMSFWAPPATASRHAGRSARSKRRTQAGQELSVLSHSGVIGELVGDSPLGTISSGQSPVSGLGRDSRNKALSIGQFAERPVIGAPDHGAPVYVMVGTSAEVGKSTAGLAILQSLRQQGRAVVVALKATGTGSVGEIATYLDFGAAHAFDCVDFGLPTTYPSAGPASSACSSVRRHLLVDQV